MKEEKYIFEDLNANSETVIEAKDIEIDSKRKIKRSDALILLAMGLSLFLGLRWRLGLSGKMFLLSGILILPIALFLERRSPKDLTKTKGVAIMLFVFIFSYGLFDYSKNAIPDLKFAHENLRMYSHSESELPLLVRDKNKYKGISVESSDPSIIKYDALTGYIHSYNYGIATLVATDQFGNTARATINVDGKIPSIIDYSIEDVMEVDTTAKLYANFITSEFSGTNSVHSSLNPSVVDVSGSVLYAKSPGTALIKSVSVNDITSIFEVTVVDKDTFVLDNSFYDSIFERGIPIDLDLIVKDELVGKPLDIAVEKSMATVDGNRITFIDSGLFTITVSHGDVSQELTFYIGGSSLRSVIFPQIKSNSLTLNEPLLLQTQASPSYAMVKNLEYYSMDASIVRYEDGYLIPGNKGKTQLIISNGNSSKAIEVIVE